MKDASRPLAAWQKWICWILGGWLIAGSLAGLAFTFILIWASWVLVHTHATQISSTMLAMLLGRLTGGSALLYLGVRLLRYPSRRARTPEITAEKAESTEMAATSMAKAAQRSAIKRWRSCNVLQIGPERRQLWGFIAARGGFSLNQEQTIPAADPLPLKVVAKDWKTLFQPKLNIAWLPFEQVFLRVTQLPAGDFNETLAMVELQLEKLSPLPVTQIAWNIQILPQRVDNLQTVIVIIVARDLVQEFLGQLEGQGYLADQLELPMLDQLQATPITGDGAWIYPGNTAGKFTALVAWWYGGTLRNLGLLHLPAVDNRDTLLKEQLTQMAWSGELEGWLTAAPHWHLVADETAAANWQPMFRSWLGQPVESVSPLSQSELAKLTARRAARSEAKANILPVEYSARYQQQFFDRLWIRGLLALLAIYGFGVLIYFAVLQVQDYRTDQVTTQVAGLSRDYTNTLQLKAQLDLLQEREALKFAALDCWKKTAELLPEGVTLESMEFRNGKTLVLNGKAPADQRNVITDFNEALRKATINNGQPLFEKVVPPNEKLLGGNSTIQWNFSADLGRTEEASQ